MEDSLTVLGVGFGVVFVGLLCLIGIIYLMSFFVSLARHELVVRKRENDEVVPQGVDYNEPLRVPASRHLLAGPDRRAAIAAISAAVSEYMGTDPEGIRIRSIRLVGEPAKDTDRRELIAVISASIASEMGTDVSAIRIHSIKKVS